MVLEDFLQLDSREMISSLENYQQSLILSLIEKADGDYSKAADNWLMASPANTYKFGGEHKSPSIFKDKIFEEMEKFICGCDDGRYDNDREMLSHHKDLSKEAIISVMSAAIGNYIGVAGAYIAPVVVLLFLSIGKIVKNAWCETMKAKREAIEIK